MTGFGVAEDRVLQGRLRIEIRTVGILTRGAGSQFDPELVGRFVEMMRGGGR